MVKKDHKDILFGYACIPSYGCYGEDDGGFSIAIYADGRFIYKTYIFDEIEKVKIEYKISNDSMDSIRSVLEEHQLDICNFDEHLDNGSCDGNGNVFIFSGKRIITWNIETIDEEKINKINPNYYKEYLPIIKQENMMLCIFLKIAKILKSERINLEIHKVSFDKKSCKS